MVGHEGPDEGPGLGVGVTGRVVGLVGELPQAAVIRATRMKAGHCFIKCMIAWSPGRQGECESIPM
jgi:hypothetical protein